MGVAGLLGWQRLTMGPLRAELDMLRERQGEVQRLRRERERLRVQQVPAEELARLRADRAAIERLRGEMSAVQTSSDEKTRSVQARASERFAVGQSMPAANWRNAGAATAAAALETVLWAAAGGDVDAFARRIQFDPRAKKTAGALWEGLPPDERVKHASPEHLMAFLSIKDVPVGAATVESWGTSGRPVLMVGLRLTAENGRGRSVNLALVPSGEEWKLHTTEAAVAKYAAALRGPAAGSGPESLSPR